jgi:uncharacterized protein YbbK (DUF523 family)
MIQEVNGMGVKENGRIYLVSACLLGCPSTYDGRARPQDKLIMLAAQGQVVPICPEVAGGLGVPRPPAEIVGGDGSDVLDGQARVMTIDGEDVTTAFIRGAEHTLAVAQRYGVARAILKQLSPSCGSDHIYDGTHSGRLRAGPGVTAALLRRHNVTVWSEEYALTHL